MFSKQQQFTNFASIMKTKMHTRNSQRVVLPSWLFHHLGLDRQERQYLLFIVKEGSNEITVREATVAERVVGLHLDTYLAGMWEEPTEDEIKIQLELEEAHRLNPPKFDENKVLLEYPFSRLTKRENEIYNQLPVDVVFTHTNLRELGMSVSSAIHFIKRCLELELIKQLDPLQTYKRGRPVKRFMKCDDYPREVPWEMIHATQS